MTDDQNKSVSMLELHREWQWLNYKLIELGGELDDELESFFTNIKDQLAHKVDSYDYLLTRLEAEEESMKQEAAKFSQAAKSIKIARERLKSTIKYVMEMQGVKELSGVRTRFTLKNSRPSLDIDGAQLPAAFLKQVVSYEPDKDRIRAELEVGNIVAGARLVPVTALTSKVGSKK